MEAKVLVVDDEQVILETVCYRLAKEGFEVVVAGDGPSAVEKAFLDNPDLIVLDIMLPEQDGYEVCKTLRSRGFLKPVILVSAKDEEVDKVIGLEVGADDYLTKPFSQRELVARIRAHLRREKIHDAKRDKEPANKAMVFGALRMIPESREVFLDGAPVALSLKEYELLLTLATNAGRVMTREQLIEKIWGYDFEGDSNIVQVTVKRLRQKLKDELRNDKFITTLRGVGYRFVAKDSK